MFNPPPAHGNTDSPANRGRCDARSPREAPVSEPPRRAPREVVLTCQGVEGRPGRVLLHDLLLERETVDAMTSHGLTPARPSSLVNRRLSACPAGGAHSTPPGVFWKQLTRL